MKNDTNDINYRGYRFRFYPTAKQEIILRKTLGCSRFVYNHFLALRVAEWTTKQQTLTYGTTSALLTQLKKEDEMCWLKDVSSVALQQSLQHLDTAYRNFFRGLKKGQNVGFPRFKKKSNRNSIELTKSGFTFKDKELKIAKLKTPLRIKWSRELPSNNVSSITITLTPSGKWFVSLLVADPNNYTMPRCERVMGVDLGIETFATLSTGEKVRMPELKPEYAKLKKLQRIMARKQKGSNNRNKARIQVARQHERITNIREDFQHKLSTRLINDNQVVVIEDLNVKGMVRNRRLARAISQQGWSAFVTMLKYKAAMYGRHLMQVDRYFPSSKTCSSCGIIQQSMPLSVREWTCNDCGATHDRDVNAALNLMAVGTTASAFGENVSPASAG